MKIKLFLLYIILSINTLYANSQSTIFTNEELQYLKNKKELRMCTISTFEPFEHIMICQPYIIHKTHMKKVVVLTCMRYGLRYDKCYCANEVYF